MGKILLEGLEFHAFHGVHPEERLNGQLYRLTVTLEADLEEASKSDRMENTIDYSEVYRQVENEMAIPSNLLEHVGKRIIDRLHIIFPAILSTEIKITKLKPPIDGRIEGVSVILYQKN